jgi:hypothetical protein
MHNHWLRPKFKSYSHSRPYTVQLHPAVPPLTKPPTSTSDNSCLNLVQIQPPYAPSTAHAAAVRAHYCCWKQLQVVPDRDTGTDIQGLKMQIHAPDNTCSRNTGYSMLGQCTSIEQQPQDTRARHTHVPSLSCSCHLDAASPCCNSAATSAAVSPHLRVSHSPALLVAAAGIGVEPPLLHETQLHHPQQRWLVHGCSRHRSKLQFVELAAVPAACLLLLGDARTATAPFYATSCRRSDTRPELELPLYTLHAAAAAAAAATTAYLHWPAATVLLPHAAWPSSTFASLSPLLPSSPP